MHGAWYTLMWLAESWCEAFTAACCGFVRRLHLTYATSGSPRINALPQSRLHNPLTAATQGSSVATTSKKWSCNPTIPQPHLRGSFSGLIPHWRAVSALTVEAGLHSPLSGQRPWAREILQHGDLRRSERVHRQCLDVLRSPPTIPVIDRLALFSVIKTKVLPTRPEAVSVPQALPAHDAITWRTLVARCELARVRAAGSVIVASTRLCRPMFRRRVESWSRGLCLTCDVRRTTPTVFHQSAAHMTNPAQTHRSVRKQ